jgi:hypothetical protein
MENKDINTFKENLERMIATAQTHEDLDAIGEKINYAIDNKLDVDIMDYQIKASKKMREIYNKIGNYNRAEIQIGACSLN